MVMELVEGASLAALLAERGKVPADEAVPIARQACDALCYLHANGIVHRDVKPGNIVLTEAGQVKLLDLGISHVATARRLTIAGLGASIGTPDYMSPAQLRGRFGDARVDLFALGTTLYELLTGRLPYDGAGWEERAKAKRREDPTPLSTHLPEVDRGIEAIVMRAIAPDPREGYQTALDLLTDLRDPAKVEPRAPVSDVHARRHRIDPRPVAATLAIVAALSLVGGVAWLGHRRYVETMAEAAANGPAAAPAAHPPPGPARADGTQP